MKARSQFGEIRVGQPVVVSYGNGVELGFFRGLGLGTYQYYSIHAIKRAMKYNNPPRTSYIHGANKYYRIAPFNIMSITDEESQEDVREAIEYLQKKNILKIV